MQLEHTPEPWEWQRFGDEWLLVGQYGLRPIVLGTIRVPVEGAEPCETCGSVPQQIPLSSHDAERDLLVPLDPEHPDARLLKAAPDLLRALRELLACGFSADEARLSTVVIGGARGTPAASEAGRRMHERCDRIAEAEKRGRAAIAKATGNTSAPAANKPATISVGTPGGMITAQTDADKEYPGIIIDVNGTGAAVVEWHSEHGCFVMRTYNDHDEEPQHYHKWSGETLPI